MPQPIKICALTDLKEGRAAIHTIGAERVTLCRVGERVYGFEERCSHALKPLEGARIRGGTLMCPHHGARFDLETGRNVAAPAVRGIQTFHIEVKDGEVLFHGQTD